MLFRKIATACLLVCMTAWISAGKAAPDASEDYTGRFGYDFNSHCRAAYQSFISLRMQEGKEILKKEQQEHPDNLIPVFLANYDDCLTLLFNGDQTEYRRREDNLSRRLALLEQGDHDSPWYRYTKAALYFQWAAVHIRFNEYFSAGTQFRKSYLLLKDNARFFPDFKNNQVLLGVEQALVGTIPDSYKWLSSLLGMKGNVNGGIAQVVDFLNRQDGSADNLREEAIFFYCYLKYNLLSDHKAVWRYINSSELDFKNNMLYVFMKANFALNDNKAAVAQQVLQNRNSSDAYLKVPIFDYQLGNALLLKMDDDCIGWFRRFLSQYRGNLFIKETYEKMSFYYLATGNVAQAIASKDKIKTSGTATVDADKQAQRYADENALPMAALLRARLYCDGGYFANALSQLKEIDKSALRTTADKLEYNYRYARVFSLTGQYQQAIPFYEATIQMGSDRPEHFAARSALELGQIYEQQGLRSKAIESYRNCLSMKNHDYKASLDQKAKAGIGRLGGA